MPWEAIAGIGTLAGGIGKLAQGFSGSGGIDKGDTRWAWQHQIPYMVKGAKAAGLHPLAALGVSPASGPIARQQNQFDKMGQGVEDIAKGLTKFDPLAKRLKKAQVEQEEAKAKLLSGQALQIGKARKMDPQHGPPYTDWQSGSGASITEENIPTTYRGYASGLEEGKVLKSLEQLYADSKGFIRAMPAEGAQDYMSESAIENIPYQFKKIWEQLFIPTSRITPKKAARLRKRLDKLERFLKSNNEMSEYEYLAFDDNEGLPRIKQWHRGPKTLFYKRGKGIGLDNPERYTGYGRWRNYK